MKRLFQFEFYFLALSVFACALVDSFQVALGHELESSAPESSQTDSPRVNREAKPVDAPAAAVKHNSAITIEFDQNGNLVLRGDDPNALDKLEELMLQKPPPRKPFVKFDIKHTRASWIVLNLKDYFKDAEDEDSNSNRRTIYYFESFGNQEKKKEDPQLSGGKKPLKFVDDNDTNTVIVRNASPEQLELITELIALWDTPTKTSDKDLRYSELVPVRYSKAESVVETIKDAYRDLLSSNDKAFQQAPKAGGSSEVKRDDDEDVVRNGAVNFLFEGKLSLGVDRVSNSVLVSTQGKSLLELVKKMVHQLDEAAKPSGSTTIVHLPGANSESMQKALQAMFGKVQPESQQQPPNGQPQANQEQPNMSERPRRDRRKSDRE